MQSPESEVLARNLIHKKFWTALDPVFIFIMKERVSWGFLMQNSLWAQSLFLGGLCVIFKSYSCLDVVSGHFSLQLFINTCKGMQVLIQPFEPEGKTGREELKKVTECGIGSRCFSFLIHNCWRPSSTRACYCPFFSFISRQAGEVKDRKWPELSGPDTCGSESGWRGSSLCVDQRICQSPVPCVKWVTQLGAGAAARCSWCSCCGPGAEPALSHR